MSPARTRGWSSTTSTEVMDRAPSAARRCQNPGAEETCSSAAAVAGDVTQDPEAEVPVGRMRERSRDVEAHAVVDDLQHDGPGRLLQHEVDVSR